jgi:hypothetical protein
MPTKRITAAAVSEMSPGMVLWDTQVRGFGIRYRSRDRIYLLKTRIKGLQRILTIGRDGRGYWGPESARREAIRLLGLIRDGKDPAYERDQARNAPNVTAVVARYLTEYALTHKKPRTFAEDERLLKLHILPALGHLKMRDIGKPEVARFHAAMQQTRWRQIARWRCCPQYSAGLRRSVSVQTAPTHAAILTATLRNPARGC